MTLLIFIFWAIFGLRFSVYDLHSQFRQNNGVAHDIVPYRWWHWPIILPIIIVMIGLIIIIEVCKSMIWCLTLGKIDLGD